MYCARLLHLHVCPLRPCGNSYAIPSALGQRIVRTENILQCFLNGFQETIASTKIWNPFRQRVEACHSLVRKYLKGSAKGLQESQGQRTDWINHKNILTSSKTLCVWTKSLASSFPLLSTLCGLIFTHESKITLSSSCSILLPKRQAASGLTWVFCIIPWGLLARTDPKL